ncbi:MAG: ribbon-helix-helix protein, CopG family [Candidatus Rokubacteria bacterium]|nr:ribbon-helix-helix protein, CopG family [Candidatus Rokubacteria bacterium]
MRTTIELTDEHRAALLELAARRGEKGFSALIAEALDAYLKGVAEADERRKAAAGLRGTLRGKDLEALRVATRAIRERWR